MANNFYISHELRVFLHTGSTYHEIIVSGTPSFNQVSTSEDIVAETLPNPIALTRVASNRATEVIKTEFEPANWNFSTNVKPISISSDASDAHNILWKYFLDHNNATTAAMTPAEGHNRNFDFNQGGSQGFFDLYFLYPNNEAYKVSNCVINNASVDIALGSVTVINWAGFGTSLDPVNFTVPSTITNSSQLSSSGFVINNLSVVSYTGQTNADAQLTTSTTGFELKSGQHKHGGSGLTFDSQAYGSRSGTLKNNRAGKGLLEEAFATDEFQFVNSSRGYIAESAVDGSTTAWGDINYITLDTNNSHFDSGLQFGTFSHFIAHRLQPSDQILIHYDNSNYGIYKVKSKYLLPIGDNSGESTGFLGSLDGTDFTTGYTKGETDTDGNTDGFSHYPFSIPQYDNIYNNIQAFNIGFKSRKHAFYSPSLSKWISSMHSLDTSAETTTLTQHAVSSTTIEVADASGIAVNEALFWNNIPADFVSGGSNVTLPQVTNISGTTITLDTAVSITKGEVVHFGESGNNGYASHTAALSTSDTHDRCNFGSFVYYMPPNENPQLSGLHRGQGNVTYFSEPCGQADTAARQNSSNGYTTATVSPNAVTSVTKHATNALRIRADKQIAVMREAGRASFAANAHYASDMLAVYTTRNHPAKFHIWAPYCDVNVKIYRYDQGTSSNTPIFVPRSAGGYAKLDGSTSLGDPINGSSGTNIDFQTQAYMTFTDSISGLTDSDQGNVAYLAVATATNTNTSSSTHIPTPAICGLVEMTNGDGSFTDLVPFAALSKANGSIAGYHGSNIVAVSATNDTAVAYGDVVTNFDIGTYSDKARKIVAINNARIATFRYGDGAGTDGEANLELDQYGDTYVFPRTTLTNVKIIGTGASTITIKKNDGTTIETITIASSDVDSTHGITKAILRGNRSGAGGSDGVFTADSAATVAAEGNIDLTHVSGSSATIPVGSKVDIGGTVAYVIHSTSGPSVRLDRQVTTATSTNYTFQPGYLETAAGTDGPFYIEGTGSPFQLVCQDVNDDEITCFGTRIVGATSGKRNAFQETNAFRMPSNATDLRFYPFRSENNKFHVYTSSPITLVSNSNYLFKSNMHYDEHVSGKFYISSITLVQSDGDCALELEKIVSDGAPGATIANYGIFYSRSLDGTTNNPFYMSNTNAVTSASISLSNNVSPISYPILGEATKPIGFKKGMPSASGTITGYITGEANETDTKEFIQNITESTQPIVNLNIRAGNSTQATNIHLNVPFAFLDTPTITIENAASYSVAFRSLVDGDFYDGGTTNTAFKVFYT